MHTITLTFLISIFICWCNSQTWCIIEHCAIQAAECKLDTNCSKTLDCINNCGASTTNQTCIYICEIVNANQVFDNFMSCIIDNGCLSPYPPVDCPIPDNLTPFEMKDMKGTWWVLKGKNPAYDCFNCQRLQFTPQDLSKDLWFYISDFEAAAGIYGHLQSNITDNPQKVGEFLLNYKEHGLVHDEQWYTIAVPTSDFIELYYCGKTQIMSYAGMLVLGREPGTIPTNIDEQFRIATAKTGNDYSKFCVIDNSQCNFPN